MTEVNPIPEYAEASEEEYRQDCDVVATDKDIQDAVDEFDMGALDNLDLGEIDPDSYQEQEDDGCEGGACKI